MMKSSRVLGALLLFVPFCMVRAQTKPQVIDRDTDLHAELKALGSQRYALVMEAGGWATLRVDQKGIDVAITTYDPTGTKLAEFDSPNGAYGPELVRLNATVAGNYGIFVRAIEEGAKPGAYELRVLGSGPKPATAAEQMDVFLANYNTVDAPGLAIDVMKNGESVYRKGFGMADLEHSVPITPNTVFHVASVSKQFTAFAMLLLAKEGRLSLNDDVRKYIPELPVYAHPITVRDLAQHTSGLRDIDDLLRLSGMGQDDAITNAEALNVIMRQTGLNFTPGTAFEYSNAGFILLAEVVARVSGMPFSTFTTERIFKPLGMTNTRFVDVPGAVVPNKAYSYGLDGSMYMKRPVNHTILGSTGLNTTVEDLCKWAMNFAKPVVGDRALMDQMEQSGKLTNGEPISYGLGLDHKDYRGQHLIYHPTRSSSSMWRLRKKPSTISWRMKCVLPKRSWRRSLPPDRTTMHLQGIMRFSLE
jgi:CubicO group peptidase (beta-lactamase class C family)